MPLECNKNTNRENCYIIHQRSVKVMKRATLREEIYPIGYDFLSPGGVLVEMFGPQKYKDFLRT